MEATASVPVLLRLKVLALLLNPTRWGDFTRIKTGPRAGRDAAHLANPRCSPAPS